MYCRCTIGAFFDAVFLEINRNFSRTKSTKCRTLKKEKIRERPSGFNCTPDRIGLPVYVITALLLFIFFFFCKRLSNYSAVFSITRNQVQVVVNMDLGGSRFKNEISRCDLRFIESKRI